MIVLQKQYKIFDAHCDTLSLLADCGGSFEKNSYNIDKRRMLGYKGYTQVFACFIDPEHSEDAMKRCNRLMDIFDECDFSGIRAILSIEGADMIQSLCDLDYLKSRCVRSIGLTWNHSNMLAGGVNDDTKGLSEFGKTVVKRMSELNILLDVSHLNDRSFYDAVSVTDAPIIATHSDSRELCANKRNITDDMFCIIRDSGGCVGINLFPEFLTENKRCTAEDAAEHIMHFLELDGENSVGIGADFDGTDNMLPEDIHGCEDLYKVFEVLKRRGVSDEVIEKISYGNFERVFRYRRRRV